MASVVKRERSQYSQAVGGNRRSVLLHLGSDALNLLKDLPSERPLFPYSPERRRIQISDLSRGRLYRQFEQERGAFARAIAFGAQLAAHFFCRERATVQTETVAIFSRGENVIEGSREVFFWNADPVIINRNLDSLLDAGHSHSDLFVQTWRIVRCVPRI